MSAPGYLIYRYRVIDRERIGELGPLVLPLLGRHGGETAIASHVRDVTDGVASLVPGFTPPV